MEGTALFALILLQIFFDLRDQLAGAHIERQGNTPQGFKICLLAATLQIKRGLGTSQPSFILSMQSTKIPLQRVLTSSVSFASAQARKLTHCAARPFQIKPASIGFDLGGLLEISFK
ncbi:MAG: hypothetical protein HFF09_03075 [Oscillospiraceae bacterium]|nr:hypothetical protein [Oscillospiraceae bacterium]